MVWKNYGVAGRRVRAGVGVLNQLNVTIFVTFSKWRVVKKAEDDRETTAQKRGPTKQQRRQNHADSCTKKKDSTGQKDI